jgi:hypothetical protein
MKRFSPFSPFLATVLLTAAALVTSVALSSCSRSGVADSLTGPSHGGAGALASGPGKGGTPQPPPPPPPAPAPAPTGDPCTNLTGFGGAITVVAASVPQNRAARLRIEMEGDVAAGTLLKLGSCSSLAAPTVTFPSGRATVSGAGVSVSETFGAIAQVPGEPGVLVATNANGDILEIIWPTLAVPPVAGPPIIRVQLARSGQAGSTLSVSAAVTARTANGVTATFTAAASNLLVPALK